MSWGIVASVGVGLLTGSEKKGQQTSTQQEMDPAMRPFIFGDADRKGMMPLGYEQLLRSQSPEKMAGWNMMQNRGLGLMGGSVAGNPFSQGYQGGTNFAPQGGMGNGMGQYAPPPVPMPPAPTPAPTPAFDFDQMMAEWQKKQQEKYAQQAWEDEMRGAGAGGGDGGGTGAGGSW
jgi:hypothetical protein